MVDDFEVPDNVSSGSLDRSGSPPSGRSPFDQIRRTRPDGTEFWSARELQTLMGYAAWQKFEQVIRRAQDDFLALGGNCDLHFTRSVKRYERSNRHGVYDAEKADCELTRAACYMVALNCQTEEGSRAKAYFAAQTRRAEIHLPPCDTPSVRRPWSERMRESIMDHRRYIIQNLPKGAFSVYSGTIPDILTLEDVLVEHLLPLLLSDGPDNSIGQRYPRFRETQPWAGQVLSAPLYMPAQRIEVPVYVYLAAEWPYFREWLESIYLPENLPDYLCWKYPRKEFGLAPPSAADHTCRLLTGAPARLEPAIRRRLTAAGGIIRLGYRPPDEPIQREMF